MPPRTAVNRPELFEDYECIPTAPVFILGVDPGKETGVALYDVERKRFEQQWSASSNVFVDWLMSMLPSQRPYSVLIACERFDISPGTSKLGRTATNWSIEQAGVCRHMARRHAQGFILQDRATPKHMASNARLREEGWFRKGPDHVNDATRHVVLALARQYKVPPPWIARNS